MGVALKLEHISKAFPGVRALTDVSFTLQAGEIRALVGGVSPNRRKFRQPNSSPATIASRSII